MNCLILSDLPQVRRFRRELHRRGCTQRKQASPPPKIPWFAPRTAADTAFDSQLHPHSIEPDDHHRGDHPSDQRAARLDLNLN